MKIGIVCYPTYGGSGIVATEIGMALARLGHEVHFIAYNQPVKLEFITKNVFFHQVFVPEYPLFQYEPYELALTSKIVDTVKNNQLEVLHVHYAIPHAYAAYNAKQILSEENIDIAIVTTLHGTDITLVGNNPSYKPAVTFSINKSDIVTCVSQSLKNDTIDFFNIEREIEVVPNFIDIKSFDNIKKSCQSLNLSSQGEFILTHVSNFRAVKRIEDIVRAFDLIQKKVDSKLLLVGEGPEMEKIQVLVNDLNLNERVSFLGKSNDVYSILCLSDLFFLLSESESFGLAALEAMASQTPVISTNTGGLPEVNIDSYSGYTLDVGDIDSIAKKTIDLLSSKQELDKFKKQAFENAKRFDINNIMPLYLDIYKRAMDKTISSKI